MGNVLPAKKIASDDLSQKLFIGTMLSMSWQMAIAVLVPTVGGYQLDNHFKTAPVLTLIGLTLAVVGSVLLIRRAIKELNTYMLINDEASADNPKVTRSK